MRFIDSARFMNEFLDSLSNNLSENIHKMNCKHFMKQKDCKKCQDWKDDCIEWCEIYKDC